MTFFRVLIPLRDSDVREDYFLPLIEWLRWMQMPTCFLINGPLYEEGAGHLSDRLGGNGLIAAVPATHIANPYAARNAGLRHAFEISPGVDYAVLLDADVLPSENYRNELMRLMAQPGSHLIAGRTMTAIPPINTYHFNRLREAHFECYDGFTPPDHTIGANMVISKVVWQKLGPMRQDVSSGGDGCYGLAWKALGEIVTPGTDLIVTKTIYGMDFKGIIQKQLHRACCYPPEMVPSFTEVKEALRHEFGALSWLLLDEEAFATNYAAFIDHVFKLGMRLGQLRQHLDKHEA
jgi:hypothetical protein